MSFPVPEIGIGIGYGVQLILDKQGRLHLQTDVNSSLIGPQISLPLSDGLITQGRIDFIKECLDRLRVHAQP